MDTKKFINKITSSKEYKNQIVYVKKIPQRKAIFGELKGKISCKITKSLSSIGIKKLYSHQVEAVENILNGNNVVISTSTASGKTLCYYIPILEELIKRPESRFLLIYPTKALAQDQLRILNKFKDYGFEFNIGTYDGDTSPELRKELKNKGNIILTNPDMLHQGILPNHIKWNSFFTNLKYVVIDEIHTYRGIFGSNVSNVLKRLYRICKYYHLDPIYICCSATIANPKELAEKLTGKKMVLIKKDGSPRSTKEFLFWNPPYIDFENIERASPYTEGKNLFTNLIKDYTQTIAFTRTRLGAELLLRYSQEALKSESIKLANSIKAYRGGYLPNERRETERKLASGELLGVTSTNALELGIDIGGLDASLIIGYPGTIASTWQQAGRSGRKSEDALAVFIANNSPIDQFLMRNPEYFFGKSPESAVIDPYNPYILTGHLRCALFELPIDISELPLFGEFAQSILQILEENGQTKFINNKWYWSKYGYPAGDINLRSINNIIYTIMNTKEKIDVIGTIDEISAFSQVHDHAIYIHNGETYFVNNLDTGKKIAYVEKRDIDYYTQAISEAQIKIDNITENKNFLDNKIGLGDVTVTSIIYMFKKIKFYNRESIGFENLKLPSQQFDTTATWIVPTKTANVLLKKYGRSIIEGLTGIANVFTEVIPVFTMGDQSDIGNTIDSSNLGVPTLFIYDRFPGGMGFSERIYEKIEQITRGALKVIEECPCKRGCPSCVGAAVPPFATSELDETTRGKIPDKEAAIILLHEMLQLQPYIPKYAPPSLEYEVQVEKTTPIAKPKIIAKKLPANIETKIRKQIRESKNK
jgi:DEAD/DEAH box helicase domain-containing protein